jgi:hypothetical protein
MRMMMRGEVKMERIERYGISHLLFVVVDLPIASGFWGRGGQVRQTRKMK